MTKHEKPKGSATMGVLALYPGAPPPALEEPSDDTVLHRLWSLAAGAPGYKKSEWLQLERALWRHGQPCLCGKRAWLVSRTLLCCGACGRTWERPFKEWQREAYPPPSRWRVASVATAINLPILTGLGFLPQGSALWWIAATLGSVVLGIGGSYLADHILRSRQSSEPVPEAEPPDPT